MGGDPLALVDVDEDRNVRLVEKKPGPVAPTEPPRETEAGGAGVAQGG
jgi:hypothetical protein